MHPKSALLGLICAALCSLSACSGKPEETAAKGSQQPIASATEKPSTPVRSNEQKTIDVLTNKLGGYIKCYNSLDQSASRSIQRYESWVKNMDLGPTGKGIVYGLYSMSNKDIAKCTEAFAELEKAEPKLSDLETPGATYMQALTVLGAVVEKAYTYYDRENYKDDGFVQGRALHAELKPAFAAFSQASARFSDELDKANTALQLDRLKLIEQQQGQTLPYWTSLQSIRARQLVDILMKERFALDEANRAFTEFETAVDARNADISKGGTGNRDITSQIPSTAEELRKSAKDLIRRVRDNTPYRDTDIGLMGGSTGWMVNGSPPRVLYDYNNFVEANNRNQ